MTKFTVGSQWKTRNGTRAVVVKDMGDLGPLVWHEDTCEVLQYNKYGCYNCDTDCDLIEPWPKSGELWVNIYPNRAHNYETKKLADEYADSDRLACVRVEWTEGEGL